MATKFQVGTHVRVIREVWDDHAELDLNGKTGVVVEIGNPKCGPYPVHVKLNDPCPFGDFDWTYDFAFEELDHRFRGELMA